VPLALPATPVNRATRVAPAVAATVLAALACAVPGLLPRDGAPVAIVSRTAGGVEIAEAVGAAGGSILGVVGGHVTIVRPGSDAFLALLRSSGFWIALDATPFRSCMTSSTRRD
jgi:hypothetical protein